jgi:type VI secretion system secreted protein Hcp
MATTDYFLLIDGIKGESADGKHKEEIDLESWSFGMTNSGGFSYGGGGGAGKVSMQDFHFTMKVNKSTPFLQQACCSGQHIPKAVLTVRKAGGKQEEYLKYTFNDLLISSYQTGGSGGDIVPTESISFNFTKYTVFYAVQDGKGGVKDPVTKGWDLKKNEKV